MRLDVSPSSTPEPRGSSSARVSFSSLCVKSMFVLSLTAPLGIAQTLSSPRRLPFPRNGGYPSSREASYRQGRNYARNHRGLAGHLTRLSIQRRDPAAGAVMRIDEGFRVNHVLWSAPARPAEPNNQSSSIARFLSVRR
jgi:hypothetical protein